MDVHNQATLDTAVLEGLADSVGGDRGFVVELIDAYLADSAEQVGAIEAAVTAGDAAAIVRPAHTLKSSSATLGAARIASAARALEVAGRSGALDEAARDTARTIRLEWEAATAALRSWMAEG